MEQVNGQRNVPTWTTSLLEPELEKLRTALPQATEKARKLRMEVRKALAQLATMRAEQKKHRDGSASLEREFDTLCVHPLCRQITVGTDLTLSVRTEPIDCLDERTRKHHRLGEFEISLNLRECGIGSIRITNLTNPRDGYAAPHCHDRICWRDYVGPLQGFLQGRDIPSAVETIFTFLQSADTGDDWGRSVTLWPLAPEKKGDPRMNKAAPAPRQDRAYLENRKRYVEACLPHRNSNLASLNTEVETAERALSELEGKYVDALRGEQETKAQHDAHLGALQTFQREIMEEVQRVREHPRVASIKTEGDTVSIETKPLIRADRSVVRGLAIRISLLTGALDIDERLEAGGSADKPSGEAMIRPGAILATVDVGRHLRWLQLVSQSRLFDLAQDVIAATEGR